MSFGTGFHDIRIIENCLNEGISIYIHIYMNEIIKAKIYLHSNINIM